MTDPKALLAEATRIRMTGQQLADSGATIPDGYFLDWDEHDDFVPVNDYERLLAIEAAARAARAILVERGGYGWTDALAALGGNDD